MDAPTLRAPSDFEFVRGDTVRDVRARKVLDSLRAGVLLVSPDEWVVDVNDYAAEALRMPREDLMGRRLDEVILPMRELQRIAREARGAKPEVGVRRGDGSEATLGYSLSAVDDDDEVTTVFLFDDVSSVLELRRQRDLLLQLAVVGEILPSLLHELRNPLAAVTTMLEVMVEESDGAVQADLHAVLWEMRRVSLGLEGIGGVGRSLRSDSFEAVDEAVREVCRILSAVAARKGVTLLCEVPGIPLLLLSRGTVKAVVFNLVKNAVDACRRDDRITVRASLDEGGRTFSLSVTDTGRGMSADVLAKCRTLFYTTKENGSGIGLAICARAAEEAGGALDIESAPGRGTAITLRVPLAHPDKRG